MTPLLQKLFLELWPASTKGVDWIIIHHQGKADLQSNLVKKMTSWTYGSPHFIILRDNDGADCRKLKQQLLLLVRNTQKPHHVRLVCQNLESWFLGDLFAVEQAFPESNATSFQSQQQFRNPDQASHAPELIEKLTGLPGKVSRAQQITRHLDLSRNCSPSFQVLVRTLRELILEEIEEA